MNVNCNVDNPNDYPYYVMYDRNVLTHSNLTPTAPEFTPNSARVAPDNRSRGAVRKQYNRDFNQRSGTNEGGTSRQFSYSKQNKDRARNKNSNEKRYQPDKPKVEHPEDDTGGSANSYSNRYSRTNRYGGGDRTSTSNKIYYGKSNARYRENRFSSKTDTKDDNWRRAEPKENEEAVSTENKIFKRHSSTDLFKKKCKSVSAVFVA